MKIREKIKIHLKINFIFYIILLSSLYILSKVRKYNYIVYIINIIVISWLGYIGHYICHHKYSYKFYKKIKNKYIKYIFKWFLFHHTIHHNTKINKKSKNIFIEFILNIISQGGFLAVIVYLLKYIDFQLFIWWAILYATIHNINYNLISSETHRKHHVNCNTNYGIEQWDILFNSMYDNNFEDINHYSINIIIFTVLMVYYNS